ncbi:TetR/AcrR family transcriptional regulator [Jeongeupia naejangsanensis]|uniref:TetR/AcrR family transcriptional regulator n=1 Tax=Jeongeupia naejangsanensis TaxID=613195 RepID=A0ABS2BN05_9NEIS|nr:TetR/AcrR family transcriptional regulator [Jeongeupia naejangsanensis]MBM3116164.1 TetR/AcrR family transcriptional regulator [Jeongeupia naejangsanensis]
MATQIERSSATQTRLIEATITLLDELGYARLSETRICERAGVSRGALRHHFPSGRYDLLPMVVERLVAAEETRFLALGPLTPLERVHLMLHSTLTYPEHSTSVALLQIWMAARGDAKLYDGVGAIFDSVLPRLFGLDTSAPSDPQTLALRFLLHGAALHRFNADYDIDQLRAALHWALSLIEQPAGFAERFAAFTHQPQAEPA